MDSISVVGCGWLGLVLAQHLSSKGWQVSGCSRNPETLATLKASGITATVMDLTSEFYCREPQRLFQGEWLVINIPPGRHQQDNDYADRIELLAKAAKDYSIDKVLFVSSTAVYQDDISYPDVTEQSPLASGVRAKTMLDAEAVIARYFDHWMILRPAGLVGGERHPGRFLAGREDLAGADAPVNLVHRDDVIAAVEMLLRKPHWGQSFNLSAPVPRSRGEFYPQASSALGLVAPTFSEKQQAGKRVASDRIIESTGFSFRYPDPLTMPPLID